MSAATETPSENQPEPQQPTAPGVEVPGGPGPSEESPGSLAGMDVAAIALILGLIALMAVALVRKRRQQAREIEREPDLKPVEGEQADGSVPEMGEGKAAPPKALESAERAAGELPPEAGAPHLTKEEVEARRKEAYRAKKQRAQEEKEARRQAALERQRAEEAAAEAERQAAEAEQARLADEQRRKVAAEAGKTLAEGLAKTRGGFVAGLNAFWRRDKVIDESVLCELEEVLFSADIGVRTAMRLVEFARDELKTKELCEPEKLKDAIMAEMRRIVSIEAKTIDFEGHKPFVLMVAGVNGAGKTTTIGKLAAALTAQGKKVVLAAGDTFRAAAAEQLEVWGERSGATVVRGKEGADPGAVVFDAIKRGVQEGADVVIADTAGRLHTKAPLMEELCRIQRVMDKALPGAPHQILLVLDATNGQNAIAQAREFNAALKLDGIVLTKLDGTAKGGVVIGICDELKLPIRYIGIGEAVADLRSFDGAAFVAALFE